MVAHVILLMLTFDLMTFGDFSCSLCTSGLPRDVTLKPKGTFFHTDLTAEGQLNQWDEQVDWKSFRRHTQVSEYNCKSPTVSRVNCYRSPVAWLFHVYTKTLQLDKEHTCKSQRERKSNTVDDIHWAQELVLLQLLIW